MITIRGDIEVNEVKLKNHLGCTELRLANADEVAAAGLTPGSTSPIGLSGIRRIADPSIQQGNNFTAGANQPDKHYRHVNYPRDFEIDEVTDIATAREGDTSPDGKGKLAAVRGVEVGHVFKLGTFFTQAIGVEYLDENGRLNPVIMGCYGIGVTRVLAAAIEQNHDDKGVIFPAPIAPFQVHLLALNADNPDVRSAADSLHDELEAAGYEVLYDDRVESAGVKFNDADLLGLPVRVVVSPRNLKQSVVELKRRRETQATQVPADGVAAAVRELLAMDEL